MLYYHFSAHFAECGCYATECTEGFISSPRYFYGEIRVKPTVSTVSVGLYSICINCCRAITCFTL